MQRRKKIIFIGGIHGVGKTTICKHLAKEISITHYSASDLIRKFANSEINNNKRTTNIKGNQNLLLQAIQQIAPKESKILLDGHFCLLNSQGKVTQIPPQTFKDIAPCLLIMCTAPPEEIANRLERRDGYRPDIEGLKAFQKAEIEYAVEIKKLLGVSLFVITTDKDLIKCESIIRNHLK